MAITLDGSGGLFTRLGKIGFAFNVVNEWCGQSGSAIAEDLPGLTADIQLQFDGATADVRALIAGLPGALDGGRRGLLAYKAALKKVAQDVLIKMVNDDDPQPTLSIADALAELRRQMIANPDDIKANTVSATPTAGGSNVGTGAVTASVLDGSGKSLEYVLAEDLELTISGGTAGLETWQSKGEAAVGDKLSHEWPGGSGSTATITSTPAEHSSNLVDNGNFETFTVANVPDGWTAVVGTAGTHFGEENSIHYKDTSALKFIGNGSTLNNLTYALTVANLVAKVPYAFHMFNRASASGLVAGVAVIDLIDGSNNVIADEAGTNNSITVDLTALTTSYSSVSGFFRLPDPIPSTVKLRIRLTTAITNTKNWVFDELVLKLATRQYANYGPYLAAFTGATNWSGDDLYTVAVANNRAGKFQSFLPIVYDIENTGLILPSAGSPSIDEALFA